MKALRQVDLLPGVGVDPDECPNERYTPSSVFSPLNQEFSFTLDVCATAESSKCQRFFSKEENGLAQDWSGERVWCNPPYDDIRTWVEKAWASEAALVVMLVPAWTDRGWWRDLIEPYRDARLTHDDFLLATRFIPGRIKFGLPTNPEGAGAGTPPFWCVLLIWSRP
jgi:phage N-6-adenine-methyltransferase